MPSPMSACPNFNACNSPVCPLDPDWAWRRHGKDDPVCRYIRDPGDETAPAAITSETVDAILTAFPRIALKAREALRLRHLTSETWR